MKLTHIALRNVLRNKKRSFLSLMAITISAMSITLMFGFVEGIKSDLKRNTITYTSGQIRIRDSEYDKYEQLNPLHLGVDMPGKLVERLQKENTISSLSPRIVFPSAIFRNDDRYRALGIGVDFDLEQKYQDLKTVLAAGRLPVAGQNETVIGYRLARELGVDIGDKITILTTTRTRATNAFTMEIVGLLAFPLDGMNGTTFLVPLDRAGRFLWMDNTVTEVLIKLKPGVTETRGLEVISAILSETGLKTEHAVPWQDIGPTFTMMSIIDTVYTFIALFFFVLGSTVIMNTTMMTIYERMQEIGILGALGMTGKDLVRLFFLEAFFLGITGSLLGVILGILVVIPLSNIGINFGAAMEGVDLAISSTIYPVLNMRSTVFVFFYSLTVASLASLIPSVKAARIEPMEALRSV